KSETFLLQNSPPSMEQVPTTQVPKKSFSSEFPSSPQPIDQPQEIILHFSHQQHPLAKVNLAELFTCAGCKEYGAGKRFACQQCGILRARCDVCGKAAKGFTFRCSACSFQMHPCCAMLSTQVNFPSVHPHSLKLLPTTAISSDDPRFACGECKRKRSGRLYRCTVCDYHLHAVCAKNMINGLQANGIKGPEKPSMMGTAARVASVVITTFIGSLIEGIGEGIGEVIVQNIGRGRGITSGRTRRTSLE
ncbi:hypothetical protein U1Q18_006173, partial [Sarracenia purpurea var. burkii]